MAWCGRSQVLPSGSSPTRCSCLQTFATFTLLLLLLYPSPSCSACPAVCSCTSGEINCMEHKLRWVPEDLPANATTVLLDYNRIATLQNSTFVVQGALRHLSLRSNILGVIYPQALAGLSELRELDLSGNYLIVLQPNTFLPVPKLRMLNLGNNKLLMLEPELLSSLPHLESLFLQGNALVSLSPDVFSNLPSLHFLRLHNNPWGCTCAIQPLYQWLTDNVEKVPEVDSVSCKRPTQLTQHPIAAIGNESFAHCREPWLNVKDYAFFLLIGPSTFLTSICICILFGSLAVAQAKILKVSSIRPGALARRAERGPR
ncbi:leucine-rich repeat-containing protein 26-like [Podarcis raffonei]|uniref:leucine-rich repeat-containing protein 26-like n=1 Tax=Podarcis raffonei TaxID=65483 RepID=UPI0023292021|nr:leucine-rich repeat-containing protein 26-like [Podarcis raffonei]